MSTILDFFNKWFSGDIIGAKKIYNITGWKKDSYDSRDHLYKDFKKDIVIPEYINLSPYMSLIEDQGELGSCTANAIAACLEFLDKQKYKNGMYNDFSRLFIYYNERDMINTINEDSGASLRDGIKSLVKYGCCYERSWPYNPRMFRNKPNKDCYKQALEHTISSYKRLDNSNLDELKNCLAEGFPFVFGFTVFSNFLNDKIRKTGIMEMPPKGEKSNNGHAITCVGVDNKNKVFIIRNSWGEKWGDKGYFYMPYDYITDKDLCGDFWTILK